MVILAPGVANCDFGTNSAAQMSQIVILTLLQNMIRLKDIKIHCIGIANGDFSTKSAALALQTIIAARKVMDKVSVLSVPFVTQVCRRMPYMAPKWTFFMNM